MTSTPPVDVFGSSSLPAVSFKDVPVGGKLRFTVTAYPEFVQQRDFETRQLATWPDGNPKMAGVLNGTLNGTPSAVWASKPGSLFSAIGDAQKVLGRMVQPGDDIEFTRHPDKPNENPRLNPAKQYSAVIYPSNAFADTATTTHTAPASAVVNTVSTAPATQVSTAKVGGATLSPEQYAALAAAGVDVSGFTIAGAA